jgi:hypothetical protein
MLRKLFFSRTSLLFTLLLSHHLVNGQTVTIYPNNASMNTGYVQSNGTKYSDNMQVSTSTTYGRGWAKFPLTAIPAGSTVNSVVIEFYTFGGTASTGVNSIKGFTGDPVSMAGATLYTTIGAGATYNSSTWTIGTTTTPSLNSRTLTAAAFVQSQLATGHVNFGFIRGSTNLHSVYGYSNTTYRVRLVVNYTASNCTGTPNAGTSSISSSSGCAAVPITLSASGLTSGAGVSYQWQSASSSGGPWSNISGATSATFNTNAPFSTTYYRLLTTCSFSGSSNSTNEVSYNVSTISSPTATGTSINCSQTATLTASGAPSGGGYVWFSDAAGTTQVGNGSSFTTPPLSTTTTYYVAASTGSGASGSLTFNYTGAVQNWTVPAGVSQITINAWGAEGGGSTLSGNTSSGLGGKGGYSTGTLNVTPGEVLSIYVGGYGLSSISGAAAGGFNGGGAGYASSSGEPGNGGGGASDVRQGGSALSNRKIVAGGGGGGGEDSGDQYGHGGGLSGAGYSATYDASQTAPGLNGALGQGATTNVGDGGGGGGGYYGGGTAQSASVGGDTQGGGGGSGYIGGVTAGQTIAGNASMPNPAGGAMIGRSGHGIIQISYNSIGCISSLTPVTVAVNTNTPSPVAAGQTINCGQTATLTTSSIGPITWYSNGSGTIQIGTGSSYITPPLTATTTYYLQAGGASCPSSIVPITVTVNALAGPVVSGNTVICGSGTTTLTATGSGNPIQWYSDAAATNLVSTGTSYTTPNLTANTTYYVREAAASGVQTFTYTSPVSSTTVTGGSVSITVPSTPVNASNGTLTVYLIGDLDLNTETVAISSESGNIATVFTGAQCSGTYWSNTYNLTAANINTWAANGSVNFNFQSSASVNNICTGGAAFLVYIVLTYDYGTPGSQCTSEITPVTINVSQVNTAPTLSGMTPVCVATPVTINAAGGIASAGSDIYWYSGPNGTGTLLGTGSSYVVSPTLSTTYYARREGGCNTSADGLINIAVNQPITATLPANGDVIWRGATSVDWETPSNWYYYDGNGYSIAGSSPSSLTRTIIPVAQACVTGQPAVATAASGNANDVIIESGATLTLNNGTLNIHGNYTNNGTLNGGTGTVAFVGATGNQTITKSGGETFPFLIVNKASGNVVLANDVTVSAGLTLTNGLVEVGTNNLIMGGSTLTGGSSASYVKTETTGVLSRNVGGTATTFPIGNSSYNPAMVSNTGIADIFTLRVIDNVTADGTGIGATITEAVVNRTWMVNETTTGGSNVTLRLYWNGAGEEVNGFSPVSAFIAHYLSSAAMWDNIGSTATGAGYFETNGITSFSPFMISSSTAFVPLPIELVSFQASCDGDDKINVSWTTASEHNTSHYVVEHSRNGYEWDALTIEAAAGNSTNLFDYTYVHEHPNVGTNYYRLTQYDNDGVFELFNALAVDCDNMNSTTTLSTYPNPSEGSFYISLFTEEMEGAGVITITDAKGTLVHTQDVSIPKGDSVFYINNMNLAPGMYYIQVANGNASTQIVKHSLR